MENFFLYNFDNFFFEFEREEADRLVVKMTEKTANEPQDPSLRYGKNNLDKLLEDFEPPEGKTKEEEGSTLENLREFTLAETIIIIVAIISIFFAYKYRENRQFIAENSIKAWLLTFIDEKNFWAFIFFVVSFVSCILYVPYNMIAPNNPNVIHKTAYSTLFELPKDFKPKITKIDYQSIAFREFLILLGCCAGYTVSSIIKKKT